MGTATSLALVSLIPFNSAIYSYCMPVYFLQNISYSLVSDSSQCTVAPFHHSTWTLLAVQHAHISHYTKRTPFLMTLGIARTESHCRAILWLGLHSFEEMFITFVKSHNQIQSSLTGHELRLNKLPWINKLLMTYLRMKLSATFPLQMFSCTCIHWLPWLFSGRRLWFDQCWTENVAFNATYQALDENV